MNASLKEDPASAARAKNRTDNPIQPATSGRKRVLILGGGFAGLNAARTLGGRRDFEVTLIDRLNHYTFQPLLYQVASAALSEQEIADPLRGLLAKYKNVRVLQTTALRIDVTERLVETEHGDFSYDYLVVACGVRSWYFGHADWEQHALGLKNLTQAASIRSKLLGAFENAAHWSDEEAKSKNLTFVVIGGGATGVEMAGALAEITKQTLTKELRAMNPRNGRIVLVEAAPRLLSHFHPTLSERARRDLVDLGVEVRLSTPVLNITEHSVEIAGETIEASVIVWGGGVVGVPVAETIGAPLDRRGCVIVREDCTIPEHPEVFVVGDLAHCLHHKTGEPLGQVANVAAQQGRYVARMMMRDLAGKSRQRFEYFNKGQMATIGVYRALCEVGPIRMAGLFAWIVWIGIHIFYLSSMRNRFFVFLRWFWSLVTMTRHSRVIVPPP